jgi:transcriptional regulator with XRE-family HTH domain
VDEERIQQAVGAAIRRRREALELSQERLAEVCGLHRTYIGSVERGERNVSIRNLQRICTALGCAASELLMDAETDALSSSLRPRQRGT